MNLFIYMYINKFITQLQLHNIIICLFDDRMQMHVHFCMLYMHEHLLFDVPLSTKLFECIWSIDSTMQTHTNVLLKYSIPNNRFLMYSPKLNVWQDFKWTGWFSLWWYMQKCTCTCISSGSNCTCSSTVSNACT